MDKLPSSVRQVDCRMMRRSPLFQDDAWANLGVHASRTGVFQGRQVCCRKCRTCAEKYISSRGTRRATSGFQEHQRLVHLLEGRLVEQIPWSELGRRQAAAILLSIGEQGGVWLGFWVGRRPVVFQGWPAPNCRTQPLMGWAMAV